jgi:hypothetical protein
MALPVQIDCVIPLGTGSRHHNMELRYSLRSASYDNVWLIGECPEWFTGDHIQAYDGGAATLNIWNKLKAACLDPRVSDPFLYSNDDYFFLTPPVMPYPTYYGQLQNGNNAYKQLAKHTMRILKWNSLPTLFYDIHRPMMIDKAKFLECFAFFEQHCKVGLGLIVKSCYGNYWQIPGEEVPDVKLAYWNGCPDVDMFSIGDGCIDVHFKAWCDSCIYGISW